MKLTSFDNSYDLYFYNIIKDTETKRQKQNNTDSKSSSFKHYEDPNAESLIAGTKLIDTLGKWSY